MVEQPILWDSHLIAIILVAEFLAQSLPMIKESPLDPFALADLLDSKIESTFQFAELLLELHNSGDVDSLESWIVERGIADSDDIERIRRAASRTLCIDSGTPASCEVDSDSTRNMGASSHGSEHRSSAWKSRRATTGTDVEYHGTPGTASRYDWIEQFAQGGLGAVWKAHDKNLDRSVAVKELLPGSVASPGIISRFVDEATITGQLEHPGIVPIYEFGFKDDGCPYYAMKLLDGETLAKEITAVSKLPLRSAERTLRFNGLLSSFVAICNAIAFAHERGVIHRDLKPGNIVLGKFGEVSIVDWGIAKYYDRDEPEDGEPTYCLRSGTRQSGTRNSESGRSGAGANRTRRGDIIGTPSFLSPEQARGNTDLDPRSDVYSLGVILYEMLTGRAAFSGADTTRIIEDVRNGQFDPPRQVNGRIPKPLAAICMKAMAHDRANRYETAMDLGMEIRNFVAGERVGAYDENIVERSIRWGKKHRTILFAAIATLAIVSVVSSFSYLTVKAAHDEEMVARKSAETARDQADVARRREVHAKQLAVLNLKNARMAADEWLIESSGDIEFYPGLEDTRREWLERAVEHYQQCATETKTHDPHLKAEAARALIRLGDAQRLLGRTKLAVNSYSSAVREFRSLLAADSASVDETDLQLQLANSQIGLGLSLPQNEAERQLESASVMLHELVRRQPESDEIVYASARCGVAQARLLRPTNLDAAADTLRKAIRLMTVMGGDDSKRSHTALASSSLLDLAAIQLQQGGPLEALQTLECGLENYEDLVKKYPHRPDYIDGRMTTRILMGNVYSVLGDSNNAMSCYEDAANDFQEQVNALYRGGLHSENLAIAQVNRSQILAAREQRESARESALFGHDELAILVKLHGQKPERLRAFATSVQTLAASSSREEAAAMYADAMRIYEHLIDVDGRRPSDIAELAVCRIQHCSNELNSVSRHIVLKEAFDELAELVVKDDDVRVNQAFDFVRNTMAEHLLDEQDDEAAVQVFSELVDDLKHRTDRKGRLLRVQLLSVCPAEEVRDAMLSLREARTLVTEFPHCSACRMTLAFCELRNQLTSESASSLEMANRLNGGHVTSTSLCMRALIAFHSGDVAGATATMKSAVQKQFPSSEFFARRVVRLAQQSVLQ